MKQSKQQQLQLQLQLLLHLQLQQQQSDQQSLINKSVDLWLGLAAARVLRWCLRLHE
jgi:hypothetical protein